MSEKETYSQLRMVWPVDRLDASLSICLPKGYQLRSYQPGDELEYYRVMDRAGWPDWDDERLAPWRPRILPGGWLMVTTQDTQHIAGTAMALRDMSEFGRPGGELGWLAVDPAHTGQGLGLILSVAVTALFIKEGYHDIHLYTEHYRLPALKTYLKLGYIPYLYLPEMAERWRAICDQLNWPFKPDQWAELIPVSG